MASLQHTFTNTRFNYLSLRGINSPVLEADNLYHCFMYHDTQGQHDLKVISLRSALDYGEVTHRLGFWAGLRRASQLSLLVVLGIGAVFGGLTLFHSTQQVAMYGCLISSLMMLISMLLLVYVHRREQDLRCDHHSLVVSSEEVFLLSNAGVPPMLLPNPIDTNVASGTVAERQAYEIVDEFIGKLKSAPLVDKNDEAL